MKKTLFSLLAASFLIGSISSCSKSNNTSPTSNQSVADVIKTNSNYSLFESALVKAGLDSSLFASASVTVFAPDNDAFAASGITQSSIDEMSSDQLAVMLKYHVINSAVTSSSVAANTSVAVQTAEGANMYVSNNTNGFFTNGITIKNKDQVATNGIIQTISKVLMPPTKTIVQTLSDSTNLSLFVAAVLKVGLSDSLSVAGKQFTAFVPTDAAFATAGFATIGDIAAADQTTLTNIIRYHVVPTTVFASDLTNGAMITTDEGGTISFATPPPTVKITTSAQAASNITTSDIVTTNGVIHVIDRVMLP
jgi:uncharacterized surface protein with fasciclin (FAS1) repeats